MLASDSRGCAEPIDREDLKNLEGSLINEPGVRKKSWRKRFAYLLLFILLLYALSLLVINTSWVKSKLTHKLADKTGLEWRVGSVLWVPFGDVYVNDLETVAANESEAGGVSLKSISVSPIWGEVLQGDMVWSELHLAGVNLDVERGWLEGMMKKSKGSKHPELKESVNPAPPVRVERVKRDEANKVAPAIAKNPKPAPAKLAKPKEKKPVKKPVVADQKIVVTGLSIKVRDEDEIYFESKDIDMDIPYAGSARNGFISVVDDSGKKESIPVIWDEKKVEINKEEIELFGVNMSLVSGIYIRAKVPTFIYKLTIKDQSYEYKVDIPNTHVQLKAERVKGQFIMSGSLLSPQTWNGLGGIEFKSFTIQETQKTMKLLAFDEVYATGRMMQGSVLVDDATARSDDLTLMANGVVRKDAYAFGVLRCVADEKYSRGLDRIYKGSHAINVDYAKHTLFEHFLTPDRSYFDLYFDGKITDMEYKHKHSQEWQSLNEFFKALKKFKDNELKEDGIFQVERVPAKMKKSTPAR